MKCNLRQNKQQTTPDLLLGLAAVPLFFTSVLKDINEWATALLDSCHIAEILGADLGNVQSLGDNRPADEEHATIKYSVLAG